jgi:endonuclease YncB( thermonuclease family)
MYEYAAEITRVVDGDTVHARVDLGCDVRLDMTIRLYGINAPELNTAGGLEAKEFVEREVARVAGKVLVRTHKDRKEKFGRYLADIWTGNPATENSLNQQLVVDGLAVVYVL